MIQNCHGCKWLDRYKTNGRGYCCMVARSKTQNEKARKPDMPRCELYEAGEYFGLDDGYRRTKSHSVKPPMEENYGFPEPPEEET